MLLIRCPWCGERDHTEFTYGADANVTRPAATASARDWVEYVYFRDNPRGLHVEYWHHVQGCRQWLRVTRNTMTHEITQVVSASALSGVR
jgi:heterotetrameric sarcosine oxidase delta subunit